MYRAPTRNDSRVELDQFEAGEQVADFEGGGFRSVGAMSAIVAEAHEVGEFAKEGALFVDSVEAVGFFFGEAHGFNGDNLETRFVNAGKNLALLTATDGVGLDDCESAFESHNDLLRRVK